MRKTGYGMTMQDGVIVDEHDTVSCGHCGLPIPIAVGQTDTFSCRKCDSHICDSCAAELARTLTCTPVEAFFERIER